MEFCHGKLADTLHINQLQPLCFSNVPHTAQAYVAPMANKENSSDSVNGDKWGGGEFCPRCKKQVFIAERKQAAGNVSQPSVLC